MKKVLFGVLAVAFLASCGNTGNGPEKTATEYLNALKSKDWEKAKSLGNEDTKAKVDGIKGFGGESGITEVKDVKCTVAEDKINAECTFCCMKEGDGKVKLVKEGDKWIVKDKKETPDMNMPVDTNSAPIDTTASTNMDAATNETAAH